ncbi:hypothetical protein ATY41_07225 [Leifsonia xyli subsp. xyli]|uniref:Uncharacterized protein n=2 Tax=Leifsonia xyli subsp. xyli TaxID=59736 RepID=Q6AGN1_LEIXX|nr:hypothetical protein [Leifsonia xyli]AAT88464.1 hypothetical protein Lxx04780 [Leifsonia xyli subsp. xyli str. CTCB07]ODA91012.1 hypothetical protein ATY41_07225 [Leifsonia xyli subsp. xyli]
MITLNRVLFLTLGAMFSAYHLFLGLSSLSIPDDPGPAIVAIALYAVATAISLWPASPTRMPLWLAAFDLAVSVVVAVLVTSELDPAKDNVYATWYVAAIGTLMTVCAVRRQRLVAWLGVAFLTVQTVIWAGVGALAGLGVIGSVVWVGVAVVISASLVRAGRDALRFGWAEREATEWQAAQEAHVMERQLRLRQTYRVAAPMLAEIVRRGGDLTEAERRECRYLEGAIRDEIRGRRLLNEDVRREVMAARRRGVVVTLLDEGGIDDLDQAGLDTVLRRLAEAIRGTTTDKLIVRTVPRSSETAITVIGLRMSGDGAANALGAESDDEVDLWLEISRPLPSA